jgi:trans-aconitate methyltransferase
MHFDSSMDEHVSGLAEELQGILKDIANGTGSHTSIGRARWIKAEIEAIGCYVAWSASRNSDTGKTDVEVRIHKPEENLTGTRLAAYMKWHAEAKRKFEQMKRSS